MNERIKELAEQAGITFDSLGASYTYGSLPECLERFTELIVKECIDRDQLLGAIARGWCSEKNSHKTMDADLALAIFDEVEKQIKTHFGVEE